NNDTGIAGQEIAGLLSGSALLSLQTKTGNVMTGANGYYYFLLAEGTIEPDDGPQLATYLNDGEYDTFSFYESPPESIGSMNMTKNGLWVNATSNSISGISPNLATALGGLSGSFAYDVSGNDFTM